MQHVNAGIVTPPAFRIVGLDGGFVAREGRDEGVEGGKILRSAGGQGRGAGHNDARSPRPRSPLGIFPFRRPSAGPLYPTAVLGRQIDEMGQRCVSSLARRDGHEETARTNGWKRVVTMSLLRSTDILGAPQRSIISSLKSPKPRGKRGEKCKTTRAKQY